MKRTGRAYGEDALVTMLAARYCAPAWAFFPQVRNATGFTRTVRTADAIAMSLWPSRGLELHGFEVKISRGDWAREKADPEKAEEIARFCDRWWIVAANEEIVAPGDLPPTWGLLHVRGDALVCKVEAPELTAQPITKAFLAAILRRAHDVGTPAAVIEAEVAKRVEERLKRNRENAAYDLRAVKGELERLQGAVKAFEESSGVHIDRWGGERIGDAVRFVLEAGVAETETRLRRLRETAADILGGIDRALAKPTSAPAATAATEAA